MKRVQQGMQPASQQLTVSPGKERLGGGDGRALECNQKMDTHLEHMPLCCCMRGAHTSIKMAGFQTHLDGCCAAGLHSRLLAAVVIRPAAACTANCWSVGSNPPL